ncbi:hypothetical protein VTO42DRAFT_32 [Malbranchea cinnamomea]
MALRRSARLRGIAPTIEPIEELPKRKSRSTKKLQPVTECSETLEPDNKQTNESDTVSSSTNLTTPNPKKSQSISQTPVKTPNTCGLPKPSLEEMHPSKVQKSTSKNPDPSLVLGFRPIEAGPKAAGDFNPALANTPSKKRSSFKPDEMESLNFEFKFSCEDTKLSDEARKLMENIREDAARIKAQMIMEKNEQKYTHGEAERAVGDRKIAKPKGKASRFSEAHMAQFKKMDSIAGHPSSFRARPDYVPPGTKSLKRTISKARLDEPEKSQQTKPTVKPNATATFTASTASSAVKCRKETTQDDVSKRRPLAKDDKAANRTDPKIARPSSGIIKTPKKPTVSQATSLKPPNTTKIPTISRSPSLKSTQPPRTPQTDFRTKRQNGTPNLENLKSILRRRQPLFSNDPVKIAAGTHLPPPTPDAANTSPSASLKKHVDFSASTKERHRLSNESPSTLPVAAEENPLADDVVYPTLPPFTPPHNSQDTAFSNLSSPTIRQVSLSEKPVRRLTMTKHPAIPHGILNKKRHRDTEDEDLKTKGNNGDRVENERSIKRVKVNPAATPSKIRTPSPVKPRKLPQTTPRRGVDTTSSVSSVPRKPGLSLSRLNFLSQPKIRR